MVQKTTKARECERARCIGSSTRKQGERGAHTHTHEGHAQRTHTQRKNTKKSAKHTERKGVEEGAKTHALNVKKAIIIHQSVNL